MIDFVSEIHLISNTCYNDKQFEFVYCQDENIQYLKKHHMNKQDRLMGNDGLYSTRLSHQLFRKYLNIKMDFY